jgi:IS5 family transposase
VISDTETLVGNTITRILADKGYRGRRAAVESVIGHLKAEHRMGRNYLVPPGRRRQCRPRRGRL